MRGLSFVAIIALQRNKGHASFCLFFCCQISQGGKGTEKRGVLFFSSLPEQSLIIISSSFVTACTVGRDMVTSAVKGVDVSGKG